MKSGQQQFTAEQKAKGIATLIVVVFFGWLFFIPSCDDKKEQAEIKHHIVYSSEWDGSVLQVKDYLKSTLNDWDSYQSVEWSKVIEDDTIQPKTYMVRHKYRAKNALGGYLLKNQVFNLDSVGNVTSVTEFN